MRRDVASSSKSEHLRLGAESRLTKPLLKFDPDGGGNGEMAGEPGA